MNRSRAIADVLALRSPWGVALGDWVESLKAMPDGCVHCAVSSPPYFSLRDYGVEGQLGLEDSPEEYVKALVAGCREVKRVLRDDATFWLNLGDSYCTKPMGNGSTHDPKYRGRNRRGSKSQGNRRNNPAEIGLKHKDMIGIPWLVAFALRADGWYLRSEIIWAKPSPMTESVKDRPTKSHEQVFLLTKKPRYFYDGVAISEPASPNTHARSKGNAPNPKRTSADALYTRANTRFLANDLTATRNKRSVWRIASKSYKGAHFATFPPALVEPCILAGTSAIGVCPECGAQYVRRVKKRRVATRPGTNSKVNRASDKPDSPYHGQNGAVVGNRDPQRHVTVTETTGWKKGCGCRFLKPREGLSQEEIEYIEAEIAKHSQS